MLSEESGKKVVLSSVNPTVQREFKFGSKVVLIDTTWLPHVRISMDRGQTWESGTDMEFLTDRLGLTLNRVPEVKVAFDQWCHTNQPTT